MSKILLQTTIAEHPDDWDIARFSLLADELRAAGHEVTDGLLSAYESFVNAS